MSGPVVDDEGDEDDDELEWSSAWHAATRWALTVGARVSVGGVRNAA